MNKKKFEIKLRNKLDKEWAVQVKERDGNKCVLCDSNKYLNAHHVIPREYRPLRHDIDNGITLCPKHHKYSFEISAHRNPLVFILWFSKNRYYQYFLLKNKYDNLREFFKDE